MKRKLLLVMLPLLLVVSANAQLSGTYTISGDASQNPDFTSFSAATSALLAGVSGPVVFEVATGTYEEYVTLNTINGTSENDRVVFKGAGADNTQVVLTSNAGYTDHSTLTLDGADYVTFENMTLASTSENTAIVVTLRGGLTADRFENICFVGCVSEASNTDNNKNLVYRVSGGWMDTDNSFVGWRVCQWFYWLVLPRHRYDPIQRWSGGRKLHFYQSMQQGDLHHLHRPCHPQRQYDFQRQRYAYRLQRYRYVPLPLWLSH